MNGGNQQRTNLDGRSTERAGEMTFPDSVVGMKRGGPMFPKKLMRESEAGGCFV